MRGVAIRLAVLLAVIVGASSTSLANARQAPAVDNAAPVSAAEGEIQGVMNLFQHNVLAGARASGEKFPAYERWIKLLSGGIRAGAGSGALYAAAQDAETELKDYIPPALQGKDLQKIAAFKQRTHPVLLTKAVISTYQSAPSEKRAAAATYLSSHCLIP